jgi:hypothetical protein
VTTIRAPAASCSAPRCELPALPCLGVAPPLAARRPNPIVRARNTDATSQKAIFDHERSNSGRAQASRLAPRPPRAQSRCQRYRAQEDRAWCLRSIKRAASRNSNRARTRGRRIHNRRRAQCEAAQGNEETRVTAPPVARAPHSTGDRSSQASADRGLGRRAHGRSIGDGMPKAATDLING